MTIDQINADFAARNTVRHAGLGVEVHIAGVAHENATKVGKALLDWDGTGALQWWADPADLEPVA